MIYDRKTNKTADEKVYEDRAMRFLYGTTLGGLCVLLLKLPIVSALYGLKQRSGRSKAKISKLIEAYDIEMKNFEADYTCFNDFFIRKRLSNDFDQEASHLIAPADSCMLAYAIRDGQIFTIKGKTYTLARFLKDAKLAQEYDGGMFLAFRLRVYDCHRFCFIDDGTIATHRRIRGFLDSVNQNMTGRFVLTSNRREISVLKTANFGNVVFAEIGAMLVGRIVQTYRNLEFRKGDEKGYFELGGSTIVLLTKKDMVNIDEDILAHSAEGIETKVCQGERIGKRA